MSNKILAKPRVFESLGVMDPRAMSRRPARGMELVNLRELGVIPGVVGGDRGYNARGDIVTQTVDNVDLNQLWSDYQDTLEIYNADRNRMIDFLTFRVTDPSEPYAIPGSIAEFEEATEYGEPVGIRPGAAQGFLGYTLKWYDLAARFTWQFLANALSSQVDAIAAMAAEADNRNLFMLTMRTLFNNTRRVNEFGTIVYPFYSGLADDIPPQWRNNTFAANHNHYVTTNNAALTAASVEALFNNIAEHGYIPELGYDAVLMVNKVQADYMRNWRSLANGGVSPATGGGLYDFIPAQGTPSFLEPVTLRVPDGAQRPANTLRGMKVVGSYGDWTIVEEAYIPAGYLVGFVTGGPDNFQNPLAIREHSNASLRGLRLVKGRTPDYPLVDSFYNRGMGSGIRNRGAGAILQVTASATYTIPPAYVW